MEKYRVTLEIEERAELEHLISAGKSASRRLAHTPASSSWPTPETTMRRSPRPWIRASGPSPASGSGSLPRGLTRPSTAGLAAPAG